jgi:hypothetical protein
VTQNLTLTLILNRTLTLQLILFLTQTLFLILTLTLINYPVDHSSKCPKLKCYAEGFCLGGFRPGDYARGYVRTPIVMTSSNEHPSNQTGRSTSSHTKHRSEIPAEYINDYTVRQKHAYFNMHQPMLFQQTALCKKH